MPKAPKFLKGWPATSTAMWPLDKIKPYEKNPRTHPQGQVQLLAKMMQRFGVDQPIVVDENGIILKGHGRRLAALAAGFDQFPVVVHRGLSEDDKRAVRIADNQVALLSDWDEELLKAEIIDLREQGFDLPLLGFDDEQFADMFAEAEQKAQRELTPKESAIMTRVWRSLTEEWYEHGKRQKELGFFSTNFTRAALKAYFVKAWFFGSDIPRAATTAYTPHRMFESGNLEGKPFMELFNPSRISDEQIASIAWLCLNTPSWDKMLGMSLGVHSYRQPAEFPPLLARDLINEFAPEGARVLDPCHGWGGRLLGFMLSEAKYYHGFDTDKRTVNGVKQMFADLSGIRSGKKAAFVCQPFEDSILDKHSFDFAFTSPPYYDTEKYGGELSSWQRYESFDAWVEGFYKPLLEKTAHALKPGGVFSLQIGNQSYPLEAKARELVGGLFDVAEKRTTDMINNYTGTNPQDGEVVLILKRSTGRRQGKPISPPLSDTVEIKVSAKCARLAFTQCGPDCIEQNGCKGNCCISKGKPGDCFVTVHPDEQKRVEAAGAVVEGGLIVVPPGTRGCPFQAPTGLCKLFNKPARPFGCIASPFTLNKNGTLIVRNRYTVLPCHMGKGQKDYAYRVFRSSLDLILGKDESKRVVAHFDNGGGDCNAMISRATFNILADNDQIKRRALGRA
jgi:methylase of polypeptide subunit release factors